MSKEVHLQMKKIRKSDINHPFEHINGRTKSADRSKEFGDHLYSKWTIRESGGEIVFVSCGS